MEIDENLEYYKSNPAKLIGKSVLIWGSDIFMEVESITRDKQKFFAFDYSGTKPKIATFRISSIKEVR